MAREESNATSEPSSGLTQRMRTHFSKNQTYPSRQARWHKDWHYSRPQSHSISSDSLSPNRSFLCSLLFVPGYSYHVSKRNLYWSISRGAVGQTELSCGTSASLCSSSWGGDEVMEAFLMAVSEPSLLQSLWCFFHSV